VPTVAAWAVVFSPDGETVASAWDDRALRLTWVPSSETPETIVVNFHQQPVRSAAFDAAGKRVASASSDGVKTGNAVVWDVAALQRRVAPVADEVFASICNSALASRLTLWRTGGTNGHALEPSHDCACARSGLLSKSVWASVVNRFAKAKAASSCVYAPF
jgi:WD40 repeat protein